MTENEKIVYDAINSIVNERIEAKRFPYCALWREVQNKLQGQFKHPSDLSDVIWSLSDSKLIKIRETYNEQSYYINQ